MLYNGKIIIVGFILIELIVSFILGNGFPKDELLIFFAFVLPAILVWFFDPFRMNSKRTVWGLPKIPGEYFVPVLSYHMYVFLFWILTALALTYILPIDSNASFKEILSSQQTVLLTVILYLAFFGFLNIIFSKKNE